MIPELGFSIPYMTFNKVDFPHPDFPQMQVKPREPISRLMLDKTVLVGASLLEKETVRFLMEMSDTL